MRRTVRACLLPVSLALLSIALSPALGRFDLITQFQLDVIPLKGVRKVDGSTAHQVSYRLDREANFQIPTMLNFPRGFPDEYSFMVTFRMIKSTVGKVWNVWQIVDEEGHKQAGLRLNGDLQALEYFLMGADGNLQTATFPGLSVLFNTRWHKVMIGVEREQVTLYVDCQPVDRKPIKGKGPINTEGDTLIGRLDSDPDASVVFELQWMLIHCDPNRAQRESCNELPATEEASPCWPGGSSDSMMLAVLADTVKVVWGLQISQCKGRLVYLALKVPGGLLERMAGMEEMVFQVQLVPRGQWALKGRRVRSDCQDREVCLASQDLLDFLVSPVQQVLLAQPLKEPLEHRANLAPLEMKETLGQRVLQGQEGLLDLLDLQDLQVPQGLWGLLVLPLREVGNLETQEQMVLPARLGAWETMDHQVSTASLDPQGPLELREWRGFVDVQGQRAPRGALGAQGEKGPQGEKGESGVPGTDGLDGLSGAGGAKGEPGTPGASGVRGIVGIPGLPGKQGVVGPPGEKGDTGDQGPIGPVGLPGKTGEDGDPGEDGTPGEKGATGVKGDKGAHGEKGFKGHTGLKGDMGPVGPVGPKGSMGDPGLSGDSGVKGDQGPPGVTGVKGERGEKGTRGATGAEGRPGQPGHEGLSGPMGARGLEGESGVPGPPGPRGLPGPKVTDEKLKEMCAAVVEEQLSEFRKELLKKPAALGAPGSPGAAGPPGPPGPAGAAGAAGVPGPVGPKGHHGFFGLPGLPGKKGDTGDKGDKGDRGDDGVGVKGSPGEPGVPGAPGAPGIGKDGKDGAHGETGSPGVPGASGPKGPAGPPGLCDPSTCIARMPPMYMVSGKSASFKSRK
uniref:Collagen alpha-1(IX) chain n=1 Tax=Knipowitschia caucasica TaxID=637954 RepID=A0AAV2KA55_KNICA